MNKLGKLVNVTTALKLQEKVEQSLKHAHAAINDLDACFEKLFIVSEKLSHQHDIISKLQSETQEDGGPKAA